MEERKYNKLDKTQTYDRDRVEEFADLINEMRELDARRDYLKDLFYENDDLQQFVWTTLEGKTIAHHNIEDSHLRNIFAHLEKNGRTPSRSLLAEAARRNMEIAAPKKDEDEIDEEIVF